MTRVECNMGFSLPPSEVSLIYSNAIMLWAYFVIRVETIFFEFKPEKLLDQKEISVLHLQLIIGASNLLYLMCNLLSTIFSLNEDTEPMDNSYTVSFTVTAEADVFIQS